MKFRILPIIFLSFLLSVTQAYAIEDPFTITVQKSTSSATINVKSTVANIIGTTSVSKATGNPIKVCQAAFDSLGNTAPCVATGLVANVTYYITVNASGSGGSATYQGKTSFTLSSGGGGSQPPTQTIPTVKTSSPVNNITNTTATSGGTISSNGGATVTSSGIVWGTSANPTTALTTKTTNGWASGGPWTSNMTGLTADTLYHVRAFAKNSVGTAYGSDVTFRTSATAGGGGGGGGGNNSNFFTISAVPTTTSLAVTVAYSGPTAINENIELQTVNGSYYLAQPNKSYQKTYTNLQPDTQYKVLVWPKDPTQTNPAYSNEQYFTTLPMNAGGGGGGGASGTCRLDANGGFPMEIESEACTPETISVKVTNNTSKLYSLEMKVTDRNGGLIVGGIKPRDLMTPGQSFTYTFKNQANQALRLVPNTDYYVTYISVLNGNTPGGEVGTTNRIKTPSSAGGSSYFSIQATPLPTSLSMNVFYAGFKEVAETITVTSGNNYFKEENFTAKPNQPYQTNFTGLTPNSDYQVTLTSKDPAEVNNTLYQKTQTVKTGGASGSNTGGGASGSNTGGGASGSNTGGTSIKTGIKNPLGNSGIDTIPKLIKAILDFVVIVGIPILTLAIIYTGFLFVIAQGNKEKLGKAKQAFLYVMIGGALILGSFVIAGAIKNTVDKVVDTNV